MGAHNNRRYGEPIPQLGSLSEAGPTAEAEDRIVRGASLRLQRPRARAPWIGLGATAVVLAALLLVVTPQSPRYASVLGAHATEDRPMDLRFDEHYVSLRPRTRLEIEQTTPGSAKLRLLSGAVDCAVEPLEDGVDFTVETPQTVVRVVGTRFRVRAEGPCTLVEVREGVVEVDARRVEAGGEVEVCDPKPRTLPDPSGQDQPAPLSEDELMRRAMDAVARGAHAEAETWFQRYRQEHPNGAFVEDAIFQEAVAAAQRGEDARVRVLAEEMKARFPDSPRRKSLEELLRK